MTTPGYFQYPHVTRGNVTSIGAFDDSILTSSTGTFDVTVKCSHNGGTTNCIESAVCNAEHGSVDVNKHGDTEIWGANEGYTGDTYCKTCGVKLADCTVISKEILHGDINGDSKINLTDVSGIAKWNITISEEASGVNNDGKLNLSDASMIMKYIAKWDIELRSK